MSEQPWARIRHADGSATACEIIVRQPGTWDIARSTDGAKLARGNERTLVIVHEPACGLRDGDALEKDLGDDVEMMWLAGSRIAG